MDIKQAALNRIKNANPQFLKDIIIQAIELDLTEVNYGHIFEEDIYLNSLQLPIELEKYNSYEEAKRAEV